MGRPRREILTGQTFEICMRTRVGLPFVCKKYMRALIESIMARVQRDQKVTLCHYLWMQNHPHLIVVAKDKIACTQFYGEIQKQLTEAIKKLMGLKHLNLWKSNATSVIPYHDPETVCYRIAYLYANPARANLVDKIKDYPGVSSYRAYSKSLNESDAINLTYSKSCPWVRLPMIEKLECDLVFDRVDQKIVQKWNREATESHKLIVEPNAWMNSFDISSDDDAQKLNESISRFHLGLEEEARRVRKKENKKVVGKKNLETQQLDLDYESDKDFRRIFVYSLDARLRAHLIECYKSFCNHCAECYQAWKRGDFSVKWPPGALKPPVPHHINDFFYESDVGYII